MLPARGELAHRPIKNTGGRDERATPVKSPQQESQMSSLPAAPKEIFDFARVEKRQDLKQILLLETPADAAAAARRIEPTMTGVGAVDLTTAPDLSRFVAFGVIVGPFATATANATNDIAGRCLRAGAADVRIVPRRSATKSFRRSYARNGAASCKGMIDGCAERQGEGLQQAEAVRKATDDDLRAEDSIAEWISDRCTTGAQDSEANSALFKNWQGWAAPAGEFVGSNKWLSKKLEDRGFVKRETNAGNCFQGIAIIPEPDPLPCEPPL
jgi:hypothetical protein